MTRYLALFAVVALAACRGEQRRDGDGVRVVAAGQGKAHDRTASLPPIAFPPSAETAAPAALATPSPRLDVPTPVHGDFTDRALPAELAHLDGMGRRSTRAEERTP